MSSNTDTTEAPESRPFRPVLADQHRAVLQALVASHDAPDPGLLVGELRAAARATRRDEDGLAFRAACLVLVDLIEQGWGVGHEGDDIRLSPPTLQPQEGETTDSVKQRLRAALLVGRDRQLLEPATQEFLRRVERPRIRDGRRTSIYDIIDDGDALADALRSVASADESQQQRLLSEVICPQIYVCEAGTECPVTGLQLIDVWRFFRHTWSLEYRPTPGRTLPLIIRNAARPNLPVIGIAMLASPALRLPVRDRWIGWYVEGLRDRVYNGEWEPAAVGRALLDAVRSAINEIRVDDFTGLTPTDLEQPSEQAILYLERTAEAATSRRGAQLKAREEDSGDGDDGAAADRARPKGTDGEVDWQAASSRPLFASKRAGTLRHLLTALRTFQEVGLCENPEDGVQRLLLTSSGRAAISTALTEIRKRVLASQVAELSVCGAVAPYNELLGGKLVALLLASAEVRGFYRERYAGQVSEIASRLAGRPISRSSELLMLTTSSLYSPHSSQYNRLRLRSSDHPGLPSDLVWIEFGKTEGYGSAHLGRETAEALRDLSRAVHGARRVNNVFGEGANPRIRQLREGLEALGVESDRILHHATPRIVYGCELVPAARRQLVGLESADHVAEQASVEVIAAAWRQRWLTPRIQRDEVLSRLESSGPALVKRQFVVARDGQLAFDFEPLTV